MIRFRKKKAVLILVPALLALILPISLTVAASSLGSSDSLGRENPLPQQASNGDFDPLSYDTDGDRALSKAETLAAVVDYFDEKITRAQALAVVILYFSTPTLDDTERIAVISHSSYIEDSGAFHIVGEVQNVGTTNTKGNKIVATLYNAGGEVIGEGLAFSYLSILRPEQRSPFEIMLFRPPEGIHAYDLETTYKNTTEGLYADVQIQVVDSYIGQEGGYWVEGTVENIGDAIVDIAIIVGTFYDASGMVVATGLTFPEIVPLHPGQSSPYTLAADPDRALLIQRYAVQMEAYTF